MDMLEIELAESLTISQVAGLREELSQAASEYREVVLKCGEVCQADTAALQLLLSFQHWAKERGVKVSIQSPSEAFKASCATLALSQYFLGEEEK